MGYKVIYYCLAARNHKRKCGEEEKSVPTSPSSPKAIISHVVNPLEVLRPTI